MLKLTYAANALGFVDEHDMLAGIRVLYETQTARAELRLDIALP